jgi:FixJ family two-component response regulator
MFPARQTIVIVDDDPNVGSALKRALATYGYHTEVFVSPAECLDAVVTSTATCFVIDVHLGDHCGMDLARRLVAMGIKSPTILMSAVGTEAVRREALASGSVAFLDKPFLIQDLVRSVERATGLKSVETATEPG